MMIEIECYGFTTEADALLGHNFDLPCNVGRLALLGLSHIEGDLEDGPMPWLFRTREMAQRNLKGSIIPDLPPEEGQSYLAAMQENGLAPILIFAPTTPRERMQHIASLGRGFIYCVARKGVTGANTDFSGQLASYLDRCRKATHLPLALGFGVTDKADFDYLKGKADIAVVGSQMIRLIEEKGIASVGGFIRDLQQDHVIQTGNCLE